MLKKVQALCSLLWLVLLLCLAVLPGCASKPAPNWNERIGHYTFDQAVLEMGPPAASTRLDDGTNVSEWFLKHGPQFSFGVGTGMYGGHGGVGVGQSVTTLGPGQYLRLVFGPDGQLQRWEKVKH